MRISVRTFHRWKKEYPSFLESLSNGKDMADAKVEKMLYKRALGYDVEETERIVDVNPDGSVKPGSCEDHEKAHCAGHDGSNVLAEQQTARRVGAAARACSRRRGCQQCCVLLAG